MIARLLTQEQVDRIVEKLRPDVVRIRFQFGKDWTDAPAITFRVLLTDEASQPGRLAEVAKSVRTRLNDGLKLDDLDHLSFFPFRSESEQAVLRGQSWEWQKHCYSKATMRILPADLTHPPESILSAQGILDR